MGILAFAARDAWSRQPLPGWRAAPEPALMIVAADGSAEAVGSVLRGERVLHALVARAGQRLRLAVDALEDNAAFALHGPGARIETAAWGTAIRGVALTPADADCRNWHGRLPVTGPYLIAIGATRGNARYRLLAALECGADR